MKSFSRPSLGSLRVFSACLLSLLMLMMPIAPLAAVAPRESSAPPAARKSTAKSKPKLNVKEKLASDLFVNPPQPAVGTPNITATMSDAFVDNNASGKADPGSTVTYTATISNTGTADATGVMFDDTPDPNTGQVVGSVKISPLAYADSYNAKQNTTLNVAAPGVLTNDSGLPAPTVGGVVGCVDVTAPFACTTAQAGTLTLNADGSFTYTPPNAGFTGADTFTYTATNGQSPDDTALVTITVNANAAPVLANIEPGTLGYGNGSPPVQITNTLTVADADDTNIESATISITSNFVNGEDVLSFTNQNGITGNYVATTGILTLTGSATLANYQTALRSITYSDSAGVPTQSVRTITFVVNDGDVNSNTQTRNINVANNTPPVANDDTAAATEAGGTANGTAGTNPSGNLVTGVGVGSVADTDVEDPSSALVVVAVKTGPEGAPLVTGTVGNPLAGSYGSLTLNSNGSYTYTVDNNNATVQALRTSGNTLQDVFNYTIQDTGSAQDTATFTVTIAGANDAPTDIALSANTVAENQPINTVVGGFTSTDVDSGDTFTYTLVAGAGSTDNASFNISGANLQTSAIFDFETKSSYSIRVRTTDAGGLFFEKIFTITVTNVNETPTDIALSASSVPENQPINTVVGSFSTTDPDAGDTFTYTLVAGAGSTDNASFNISGANLRTSAIFDFETKSSYSIRVRSTDAGSLFFEKIFTITVTNVNEAPTDIALSNNSVPENQPINTVVGSFSTTDQDAGDTFTYTLVVGTGDTDNASFNISGANLRTSAIFDFETKSSYSIRVRSTDSGALFFEKQFTITVTNVNEAPVLTLGGGSPNYTEDAAPTVIDPAITVADVDTATLASGTVSITANFQTGQDVLAFTNDGSTMGNIAGVYTPGTGVLALTSAGATATVAQWQSALRAVTYNNTSQNPNTTSRTISFQVNDGALASNTVNKTMTVTAVNDAPVLAAIEVGALAYTENDLATAITSTITVNDVDNAALSSGTVSITSNFQSGQDVLSFVNVPATMGNIAGVYTAGTGVMALTSAGGTATLAQWQAALRAVKYNNSSDDPSTLTRTVTFQVDDGQATNHASNTQTRNITITAVNDPPTANGFSGLPAQAAIPIMYPAGKLGGTDVEAGTTITIDTTPINVTNGTAVLSADGSFVFTPLPNATTGSFQYRVSDNGNPGPGVNSTYVTVSFTVAGPAIYFVRQSAVGLGNCTLGNECTLATAQANIGAATNTRIFVEDNGSGTYTTSVTLNSNGWLIGQGVTGTTFDTLFGIGAPAQGTLAARPSLGLASPTITVSSAGVNVVNLTSAGTTNSVRGLNLSTGTSTTKAISGTTFGTLTTSDLVISGSGPGLDLTTGSLSGSFTSISSSGGANGIKLTTVGGSSTLGSGALSGATADEFFVSGGTVTLTYSGTINTTAGGAHPVNISGKTASGNVTFNGAVSAGTSSAGVILDNNDGATITFRGGLALTTTTNTAFNAINGGTIEVCDENPCNPAATGGLVNTLTTTTGTGLNVNGTTISSNNLEFKSISAGTGASGPASGITLNTTGSSGGLKVKGAGNAAIGGDSSGGTIQHVTSHGISLTNTTSPSFTNMNIHDAAGSGINGTQVTNFTFANGTIDIVGTSVTPDDANISFNDALNTGNSNVTGTVSITNSILNHARYHGVDIQQDTGTLSDVTISGNTFTSDLSITTSLGSAVRLIALGNSGATTVANVTKATLTNNTITNFNTGAGFVLQGGNSQDTAGAPSGTFGDPASGTNMISVTGNLMNGGTLGVGNQPDRFVTAVVNGRGQGHFDISNNGTVANPIKNIDGVVIELSAFGQTTVKSHINNNRITSNNAVGSAGIGVGCDADSLTTTTDNAVLTAYISGNNISLNDGPDIYTLARGTSTCTLNTTIANNTLAAPSTTSSARAGIRVDSGSSASNFTTVCLDISGNTTAGSTNTGTATTSPGINLRRDASSGHPNVFGIKGMAATSTPGVENFVNGQNTSTSGTFGVGGTALLSSTTGFSNCASSPTSFYSPETDHRGDLARADLTGKPGNQMAAIDKLFVSWNDVSSLNNRTAMKTSAPVVAKPGTPLSRKSETVKSAKAQPPAQPKTKRSSDRTLSHHARGKAKARLATAMMAPPPVPNFPVNVGTIPMGKSVTITFQVTLNTAMPFGTTQVSNQGSVSGSNFATVLTDDQPGTAAPNEPTITPIDAPTASASDVSGDILDGNGNPVEGAAVRMTGTQNRLTVTDANGHYHFDNVETNGFYDVTPSRVNFDFSPTDRSFSQLGNHTDAIFTGAYNGGTVNPLDTTEYFVRQQYVDFLNREPDEAGFNFWVNNIEACGSNQTCRAVKRTDTSAAFFLSVEFQQTGYLVYKIYQSAYGDMPNAPVPLTRSEFKPDTEAIGQGVIVNQTGWETLLENNKQAFTAEFVSRSRFTTAYPTTMTPAEFVDKLFLNAGVVPSDTERSAAIGEFNSAADTSNTTARAKALRRVAENLTLNQQEFNQAFVLMEYFGYLRRSPPDAPEPTLDYTGYNFWLSKLDRFNGDYRQAQMVQAFLVAGEYRQRFPK